MSDVTPAAASENKAASKPSRRKFVQAGAAGVAAATAVSSSRAAGANDRIRLGFIGVGNRGDQVLDAFLTHKDAEVVAVADIYAPYREFAASKIGGGPELVADYRKLLDRKEVDAVVINTPDHWHALQMIHACQAGKDVYVEKPLGIRVTEGRRMVDVATREKRVVQVGIQRRSSPFCREAAELVRSGAIGQVTAVRCFHVQNEWPRGIGSPADGEPPAGFDWEAWQGPAPSRPYNENRGFYRFRWFYDYSGGQLTNFGVHYLAQVHASLGVTAPSSVVAMGGKFGNYDNREVPDTLEVVWTYPTGNTNTLVTFSQFNATGAPPAARPCEIEFRGTKGTLYFTTSGYEIVPETVGSQEFPARSPIDRAKEKNYREGRKQLIEPKKVAAKLLDADHARNFLDCVKSRAACNCDVEQGHRITSAALMGNIAHQTKSHLEWDAKTEQFKGGGDLEAANALLQFNYRKPYELPV